MCVLRDSGPWRAGGMDGVERPRRQVENKSVAL